MNIVLLGPAEIQRDGDSGVAVLTEGDRRAIHIMKTLKPAIGDTIKVGVLNSLRGSARVADIKYSDAGVFKSLKLILDHLPEDSGRPPQPRGFRCPIDLVLGLPRPQVFQRILVNATTMGVRHLIFVVTARSEKSYLNGGKIAAHAIMQHVLEGLEQTGSLDGNSCFSNDPVLPSVFIYASWKRFIRELTTRALFSDECIQNVVAHPYLDDFLGEGNFTGVPEFRDSLKSRGGRVRLFIGPEAGFVNEEIRDLCDKIGARAVGLGTRILKIETALTLLQGAACEALGFGQTQQSVDREVITLPVTGHLDEGARGYYKVEKVDMDLPSSTDALLIAAIGMTVEESLIDHKVRNGKIQQTRTEPIRGHRKALTTVQLPARDWAVQLDDLKESDAKASPY